MDNLQNHPKIKNRAVRVKNWKEAKRIVDYLNDNGFKTASGREYSDVRLMEIAFTRQDVDAGILVIAPDEGYYTSTKAMELNPMEYFYTILFDDIDRFIEYVESLKN